MLLVPRRPDFSPWGLREKGFESSMKAASSFMSAASAVALSAALGRSRRGWRCSLFLFLSLRPPSLAALMCRVTNASTRRPSAAISALRPGKSFSNADIDEAVKRLFGTGMFSDVRINQSGSTLVVQVDEHSIVNQVLFQGNKKIKDAQLAQTVQLKPRAAFSNCGDGSRCRRDPPGLQPDRPR